MQKCCSFYIQDDGKLHTGTVLQLCEPISEEKLGKAPLSLKGIYTWGTQSQIAAFVFSETPLAHIKDCSILVAFKKEGNYVKWCFRSPNVKQIKLNCGATYTYGKTPNKPLAVLSDSDGT